MDLAVQVKREIGQLWADIEKPPYIGVFTRTLTSVEVWKAVQIMRAVDVELQELQNLDVPRADLIAIHFNRALLHLVFKDSRLRSFRAEREPIETLVENARTVIKGLFPKVAAYVERHHGAEYPASVCKNRDKCMAMMGALEEKPNPAPAATAPNMPDEAGSQGKLF